LSLIKQYKAGHKITLLDKLETVETAEEMAGFEWGIRFSGRVLSEEERNAVAQKKIELLRHGS
tara:strand:- start:3099 stop:3287 length:189 start_codon:yes stop_codon:yes gene_type:complete